MTKNEVLKLALEALELTARDYREQRHAIAAIREALAQPEQEPVANIRTWHKNGEQHAELWNWDKGIETLPDGNYDLYTTPPHCKPLSDVEIWNTYKNLWMFHPAEEPRLAGDVLKFARAIEAAHGIKE